jgi:hypothetical protein
MQTIDPAQLTRVTGGAFAQTDAQPQGAGLLAGIDQFLGFLGSDGFQQVVGGLRQLLASFGGQQPGQQQPDAQQMDPSMFAAAQQDPQQYA